MHISLRFLPHARTILLVSALALATHSAPLHATSPDTLRGAVVSADDEPLTGASIRWLGQPSGTVAAGKDATFAIERKRSDRRLVVSMIGFGTDTLQIADTTAYITVRLGQNMLDEVTVSERSRSIRKVAGAENSLLLGQGELFKAACCNLGESFTTNPSVDVAYTDAATGARQIRLLGLSGDYVQMLIENVPSLRLSATPFALGYVPGPWMQSIQVSKGSSSVKNGYESVTGQIDIEYLKPQLDEEIGLNAYVDSKSKAEANFNGNIHMGRKLSTGLMLHYEDTWKGHDANGDGFMDMPRMRQFNLLNRWSYFSDKFISQTSANVINEHRLGGAADHSHMDGITLPMSLRSDNRTDRFDIFTKNALVIDKARNSSLALIARVNRHISSTDLPSFTPERPRLFLGETAVYAQLLFESDFGKNHSFAAGSSFAADRLNNSITRSPAIDEIVRENTAGVYAQYTYNLNNRLIAMAGLRADHSNLGGWFATPRAHIKWIPADPLTFRISAGKGSRTVHPLAHFFYLYSSTLPVTIAADLNREQAWNYGISASWAFDIGGRHASLSADYYFTDFSRQVIVDRISNPGQIAITNLNGKSFSHTTQLEASCDVISGLTLNLAWRFSDVRETYSGHLMRKPLTPRYKGLCTLSYLTPLEHWQFDATLQLTGSGTLPPMPVGLARATFPAFPRLNAQVMRHFRHLSVYAGGENLTGYRQKNPVCYVADTLYDPTLVWGPTDGAMFYAGFRLNIPTFR